MIVCAHSECQHPDYEHEDVTSGSRCTVQYGAWGDGMASYETCFCPGFVPDAAADSVAEATHG